MMLGALRGNAGDEIFRDSSLGQNSRTSSGTPDLHRISSGKMSVDFDEETGTILSITGKQDPLGTNFIGNMPNGCLSSDL